MVDSKPPHFDLAGDGVPFESQYNELLPEFLALDKRALIPVNLDVPSVVVTTRRAVRKFLELEDEVVDQLPRFDLERVRKLDRYALALSHAHTSFLMAAKLSDSQLPLLTRAIEARATLLADARALQRHGLVDGGKLKGLKGPNGYKNVAVDLQLLIMLFHEHAEKLTGRTATDQEALRRAANTAAELLQVFSLRDEIAQKLAFATDVRIRAFTLLVDVYTEARRAAVYLRPKKNQADAFVPSLYAGRRARRRPAEEAAESAAAPVISPTTESAATPITTPSLTPPLEAPTASATPQTTSPPSAIVPGVHPFLS